MTVVTTIQQKNGKRFWKLTSSVKMIYKKLYSVEISLVNLFKEKNENYLTSYSVILKKIIKYL